MKDHYKTGSKIHGLILFEKHAGNNTVYCMKETVKQGAVSEEEVTELTVNGKNAVAMLDTDKFERHTCGALHGIFVAAGGAKTAVTAEWNKLEVTAMRAGIHSAAK